MTDLFITNMHLNLCLETKYMYNFKYNINFIDAVFGHTYDITFCTFTPTSQETHTSIYVLILMRKQQVNRVHKKLNTQSAE